MKLIVRQYLASLRERGELDAIMPDLLSQLGLNVYSKPGIGTRQDGVDVAAVGSLNSEPSSVYLFSIKSGNLDRNSWDGSSIQSLRPSLNDILDSYIPTRLPKQYKRKEIIICICLGGYVKEEVRTAIEGYIDENEKKYPNIKFEQWNGDKLAELILSSFLHENLMSDYLQSQLRKSIALLYEPLASYRHFKELIKTLIKTKLSKKNEKLKAIRQLNICLWILFSWAREEGNIESAYLCSELVVLYAWNMVKQYFAEKTDIAQQIRDTFGSILGVYHEVCNQYIEKIISHTEKKHALSNAVLPSNKLDVNLKLFDLLGRLAIRGIWTYWMAENYKKQQKSEEFQQELQQLSDTIDTLSVALKNLIFNNPTLLLPFKDDQAIDIAITLLFLGQDYRNYDFIKYWLREMLSRAIFTYETHGNYPCTLNSYSDLLEHPEINDEYREEVTNASILYPLVALWAALLNDIDLYGKVNFFKQKNLKHSTFQFWYPDESSEQDFYINNENHGIALTEILTNEKPQHLIDQVFNECKALPHFDSMSAIKFGLYPIILIGCRHYRLPIPIYFMLNLKKESEKPEEN